jgi:ribonuclease D
LDYLQINTDRQLEELCERLACEPTIAFDTEFVSEHTYRPQLCLVQVAAGSLLAIIDPLCVQDLNPFWNLLAEGNQCTIVHAGREEIGFSLQAVGKVPARLFDVQIAAGLIGLEYPAGYRTLVKKLVQQSPAKDETRTDWRKRPLSEGQLSYALNDVIYLESMQKKIACQLAEMQRCEWLVGEMQTWIQQVCESFQRKRWRRVSGISGLSARSKAVIRELWSWREEAAQKKDLPVRRVLRDDLMVEIAKRQSSDPKHIGAIRGMDRGDLRKALPELSACVERAMQLPKEGLPSGRRRQEVPSQLNMLGQLLSSALQSVCKKSQLAPSIVGNPSDVRDLIAHRLGFLEEEQTPALAQGWRAELVGDLLDDLLAGKIAVSIRDPRSGQPLCFEPID